MPDVSRGRYREVLEQAMEDVAMAMADSVAYQQRLLEIRNRCAELWRMADLGDVPDYELMPRVVGGRR